MIVNCAMGITFRRPTGWINIKDWGRRITYHARHADGSGRPPITTDYSKSIVSQSTRRIGTNVSHSEPPTNIQVGGKLF